MVDLSILIPVYNEAATLREVLGRVHESAVKLNMEFEIVVVDDGSTDGTGDAALEAAKSCPILYHRLEKNSGKGAAVRTGIELSSGRILIIQDADLEYDPGSYPVILEPIRSGTAPVVYGSRFLGTCRNMRRAIYYGNMALTLANNMLYGARLTDVCSCYKAFTREAILSIPLTFKGFEVDADITAKLEKKAISIMEVPIDYTARTPAEGKKLRWVDFYVILWTIIRNRFAE
jgi:glycosyltransferase involved in cell wall biosynthesis